MCFLVDNWQEVKEKETSKSVVRLTSFIFELSFKFCTFHNSTIVLAVSCWMNGSNFTGESFLGMFSYPP